MNEIRKSVLFSLMERYAAFIIGFVSIIILSRLLTPEETGLYSIAAALINIAQTLRSFGVYTYILQEKELTDDKIGSAVGISLILACALGGFFVLAARPIADFYNAPALTPLILILSVNFFIVSYSAVGHGILTRNMGFRSIMLISIASGATNAVVSCVLAWLGFGAACLAWASLAGIMVTLVGNIWALGHLAIVRPNLRYWRTVVHFGVFSSASGLLGELSVRAPDLLIGRLVSLEGAGLFSRGGGIVNSLSSLITGAVQPVTSSLFAKTHREVADLPGTYLQAMSYVCIVAWPALGFMAAFAHPVITLCFGEQWLASVPVAQVLCAGTAIGLIGMFAQTLLRSIGAVKQNFFIQSISVPLYILSVAIGATAGITTAALGSVVSGTLISGLSLVVLHRQIALDVRRMATALWPALVATAAPVAAAFALASVLGLTPRCLVPAAVVAGLVWLVSVFLLRHPIRNEVRMIAGRIVPWFGQNGKKDGRGPAGESVASDSSQEIKRGEDA